MTFGSQKGLLFIGAHRGFITTLFHFIECKAGWKMVLYQARITLNNLHDLSLYCSCRAQDIQEETYLMQKFFKKLTSKIPNFNETRFPKSKTWAIFYSQNLMNLYLMSYTDYGNALVFPEPNSSCIVLSLIDILYNMTLPCLMLGQNVTRV